MFIRVIVFELLVASFLLTFSQAQVSSSSASGGPGTSGSSQPKDAASSPDRVVLKVGDVQVTQAQFEAVIGALEAQQGPADLSRRALGDNYASLLMLSQQAVAHHLDSSPAVLQQLAIDRTQILSNAEFTRLKAEAKPTPEQISAYYNAHLEDYDTLQLRRVFIWKTGPGSTHDRGVSPEEAKTLGDAIRQAYAAGNDPHKLIRDPETVVLDNEPLTFQRGELPEKMQQVAFAIQQPGEWSVMDDTPDALVLIQLVSRGRRDINDVSPQIEKKLQGEALREELEGLKKKSGIWMDEAYFASKAPIPVANTEPEVAGQESKPNSTKGER